ncbi:MAG: hypothetical protein QM652_08345 [Legionella sp.]|uniref:hypothetical protein n=1 Tax=Legionella sp. TaxID=459 RepID=UPI0039E71D42
MPNRLIFLFVDDNLHTIERILRLFAYLDYEVLHVDNPLKIDELIATLDVDVVLVNLASCQGHVWTASCIECMKQQIPIICYNPDFLIKDFQRAQENEHQPPDDRWMLDSQLFQFLTRMYQGTEQYVH